MKVLCFFIILSILNNVLCSEIFTPKVINRKISCDHVECEDNEHYLCSRYLKITILRELVCTRKYKPKVYESLMKLYNCDKSITCMPYRNFGKYYSSRPFGGDQLPIEDNLNALFDYKCLCEEEYEKIMESGDIHEIQDYMNDIISNNEKEETK